MYMIYFRIILLFLIFPTILFASEEFNLGSYYRRIIDPNSYTLALLDKALVNIPAVKPAPNTKEFIKPLIHTAVDMGNTKLFTFLYKEKPEHYIVRLKRVSHDLKSSLFTEHILGENFGSDKKSKLQRIAESDSELSSPSVEDEAYIYSASMILFPVESETNKMLVYLLGHWTSLLNIDSIEKSFGLKATCSLGIASENDCTELFNIKEISYDTYRHTAPMRDTSKPQKKLGKIADFSLDPANGGIESIRLKPIRKWGISVIKGDDFFHFKIGKTEVSEKAISNPLSLKQIADEVYQTYVTRKIHKDFTPYIDTPIIEESFLKELNDRLNAQWGFYYKQEQIYMHWSFWYLTRDCDIPELGGIKSAIEAGPLTMRVKIKREEVPIARVIRSLPIEHQQDGKSKYFRFDRGNWYEVAETRFGVLDQQIQYITYPCSTFCLPHYEFKENKKDGESKEDSEGKDKKSDYKELAYNKSAVEAMKRDKLTQEVELLDRRLISLGGDKNTFELADIFLKKRGGENFFIHVKRAGAGDIDHHRTQVERCALFLGEVLDRSAALKSFIQQHIEDFYESRKIAKSDRKSKHFTGKYKPNQNFLEIFGGKQRKHNRNSWLEDSIKNPEIKKLIADLEPYGSILYECFDVFDDCFTPLKKKDSSKDSKEEKSSSIDLSPIKEFLEQILKDIPQYTQVAGCYGLLSQNIRDKATIVMAIIQDKGENISFTKQQLWGLAETKKLVEKQGFKFNVTFIPQQGESQQDIVKEEKTESKPTVKSPTLKTEASERIRARYSTNPGFTSVQSTPFVDAEGQKYAVIKIKGDGDCAFYSLGTTREDLIEKLKAFITAEDNEKGREYEDFKTYLIREFWTSIGNDDAISKLKQNLRQVGILSSSEDYQGDKDFTDIKEMAELSSDNRKYLQYALEFSTADSERKCEILENFYKKTWLNPQIIFPLGKYLGIYVKIYSTVDKKWIVPADNHLSNNDIPTIPLLYSNGNHYDLLHPLEGNDSENSNKEGDIPIIKKEDPSFEGEENGSDGKTYSFLSVFPEEKDIGIIRKFVTDLLSVLLDTKLKITTAVTLYKQTKVAASTISKIKGSAVENKTGAGKIWDYFINKSDDEIRKALEITETNWEKLLAELKKKFNKE